MNTWNNLFHRLNFTLVCNVISYLFAITYGILPVMKTSSVKYCFGFDVCQEGELCDQPNI